jgi:hypothetical protein
MCVRNDNFGISDYEFIEISYEGSGDKQVLLYKLKSALNSWIQDTEEGKAAWEESSEDFNIGDLTDYCNKDSLKKYFEIEGIEVNIEMGSKDLCIPYDTILAEPEL